MCFSLSGPPCPGGGGIFLIPPYLEGQGGNPKARPPLLEGEKITPEHANRLFFMTDFALKSKRACVDEETHVKN